MVILLRYLHNKDRQVGMLANPFENAALTEIDEITQNRH
jgi:hypothetical protein